MRAPKIKYEEGMKIGELTLLQEIKGKDKLYNYWECSCSCGNTTVVRCGHLKQVRRCRKHPKGFSLPKGHSGLHSLYQQYKSRAISCDRDMTLSLDQFLELTSSNCYYCGTPPSQISNGTHRGRLQAMEHSKYIYNGIDRIDNDVGYTLSNCVPCCKFCNMAKHTRSKEQFISWVITIVNHLDLRSRL